MRPPRRLEPWRGLLARRRAALALAISLCAALIYVAPPVAATPVAGATSAASEESGVHPGDGDFEAEVAAGFSRNYWVVGPALEYFASATSNTLSRGNAMLGVGAMWRLHSFGPHLMLLSKPSVSRFSDARFLAGLGLRGFIDVPGFTEVSYGVGGHAEIRLADHFWLGYLTPLELGATIWSKGSWRMELFIGVRRAIAGKLINFYLIDPNGFNSREAQAELDDSRSTWRAFSRIVFSRRLD